MNNNYYIINDEIQVRKNFNYNLLSNGQSIYEVLKIKDGVALFFEKHLERLHNTARLTNLNIWLSDEEIKNQIKKIIKVNDIVQGSLKFVFNFELKTFTAFFENIVFPTERQYKEGVCTAFYRIERENPNAKVLNLTFREKLDKFIKERHIFEAILVDSDGNITEGSKSNVFMIKGNRLFTTPAKTVLPGITRSIILEICKKLNIEVIEQKISYEEAENLEGMIISSTPFDVLPVKKINNISFDILDNSIMSQIKNEYDNIVENYISSEHNV